MLPAAHALDEQQGTEFPFPRMDPVARSSSSDTLPSAHSSLAKAHHSSSSSPSPRPARRRADRSDRDREREQGHDRDRDRAGAKSKLLARLMHREEGDAHQLRTLLVLTSERLEHETRRADDAERRVGEALQRLRAAHEATMLAQAEAARATAELRLHRARLDEAQREIFRAQELVDRLEQQRLDAEAEAARARDKARRFREDSIVARAREEGRRQGFQEGLSRGRNVAHYEAAAAERANTGRYARPRPQEERFADDDDDDDDENNNNNNGDDDDDDDGSQPEVIVPIPRSPEQSSWRPPSRSTNSRASRTSPPRVPEETQDPILSIRTTTTHSPAPRPPATPDPVPVPDPSRIRHPGDDQIRPVPIHDPAPPPSHPPVDIPADSWIPYMDRESGMFIHPPRELSRSASPRAPGSPPPDAHAPAPAQEAGYEPSVRSRDFAYAQRSEPAPPPRLGVAAPFSPQSRTSTNISQYDLVSAHQNRPDGSRGSAQDALAGLRQVISAPPGVDADAGRPRTPAGTAREDRRVLSPRGPRPRDDFPLHTAGPSAEAAHGQHRREQESGSRSPLERLFKKRYRTRTSGSSNGVPDITVESPSETTGSRVSTTRTVNEPHLLSPEFSHRPLPGSEHPAVSTEVPDDQRPLPPLPELGLSTPGAPLAIEQLPAGFVPLTSFAPAAKPGDWGHFQTDAASPHRSASSPGPKPSPRYAEAPVPPGVVYPVPPGRSATPHVAAGVPLPPSPAGSHRKRSPAGHLSPLSLQLF
ncbi:hypothetical protein AcV7_002224 [Taiwanofungus camphoratus]|nr:hypothetical protein AcV7_002224 [Antrodia cinnamomea]